MKMKNVAISVVASLGLFAAAANAATTTSTVSGGTVHFTGEIVSGACAVSTDTADQTVNLGQYTTGQLASSGATTTPVPFSIKLINCSSDTYTTAKINFQGSTLSGNSSALAVNSAGSNATSATGVGIQILDNTSAVVALNTDTGYDSTTLAQTTGGDSNATNIFNFSAQYLSTGSATAGQADADATFTITYS